MASAARPAPADWAGRAARLRRRLARVLDHTAARASGVEFRVVGPAAGAMRAARGWDTSIDLLFRTRADLDRFVSALATLSGVWQVRPLADDNAGHYFARYFVADEHDVADSGTVGGVVIDVHHGVTLDLFTDESRTESDTNEFAGRGPWKHCSLVECGQHAVPAVAMELSLLTELDSHCARRPNAYEPVAEYVREHGCDLPLLRRRLAARADVPELVRREILNRLGDVAGTC